VQVDFPAIGRAIRAADADSRRRGAASRPASRSACAGATRPAQARLDRDLPRGPARRLRLPRVQLPRRAAARRRQLRAGRPLREAEAGALRGRAVPRRRLLAAGAHDLPRAL